MSDDKTSFPTDSCPLVPHGSSEQEYIANTEEVRKTLQWAMEQRIRCERFNSVGGRIGIAVLQAVIVGVAVVWATYLLGPSGGG